MDFVIDTVENGEGANPGDSFKPSKSSEENCFSFVTDVNGEEELNDEHETDDESDTDDEDETDNPHATELPNEQDSNTHPLAHLFEEVEMTPAKTVSKKSFISMDSKAEKAKLEQVKVKRKKQQEPLSKKLLPGLTNKVKHKVLGKEETKNEINKLLEKSEILKMDMHESAFSIDPPLSKRKKQKLRKQEREKTKGEKWFGLPATELTEEVKRDLEIMQMRSVLDPKHFYKKNHTKVLPKYFQIGKVLDSPLDFYNNRLTKKERKKTLVDELLADAQFNKYNKTKYAEILKEKQKTHYKAWRQAKRVKNKKK